MLSHRSMIGDPSRMYLYGHLNTWDRWSIGTDTSCNLVRNFNSDKYCLAASKTLRNIRLFTANDTLDGSRLEILKYLRNRRLLMSFTVDDTIALARTFTFGASRLEALKTLSNRGYFTAEKLRVLAQTQQRLLQNN